MAAANKFSDTKVLGELTPLNQLERDKLYEIAEKSTIKELKAGEPAFRKNSKIDQTLYLLSGTVELTTPKGTERVRAGTKRARLPLYDGTMTGCSAVAKGPTTLLMIDTELLDLLIHWSGNDSYDVEEFEAQDPGDWMTRLLQHETVIQLSPDKIQTLMSCIQPQQVSAGQVIVNEGDTDRCYYLISKGSCQVTRRSEHGAEPVELAELNAGDAFGEEALIADTPRSATVTMLEDGLLLRLDHANFDQHLKHPLLDYVTYERVLEMKKQGAEILDVREPKQFQQNGLGTNLPLANLRAKVTDLDKGNTYIVICNDGKQSAIAGFLLRQKGLNVYVLENGLNQLSSDGRGQHPDVVDFKRGNTAGDDLEQQRLREQLNEATTKLKTLEQHHAEAQRNNDKLKTELTQLHKKAKQMLLDHEAQRAKQESSLRERIAQLEEQARKSHTELEHTHAQHNEKFNALQHQIKQHELDVEAITTHSTTLEEEITRLKTELTQARKQSVKGSAQEQHSQQEIAALRSELEQSKTHSAELDKTLKQSQADLNALEHRHRTAHADSEKQQQALEQLRNELDAKTQQLVELEKDTAAKFELSAIEFEQLLTQHSEESDAANAKVAALEQQLAENQQTTGARQQQLDDANHTIGQLNSQLQQALNDQQTLKNNALQLQNELTQAQQHNHTGEQLKQQLSQAQAELAQAQQHAQDHQRTAHAYEEQIASLEGRLQSQQQDADQRDQTTRTSLEARIAQLEQQVSAERQRAEQTQQSATDTDHAHRQTIETLQQQLASQAQQQSAEHTARLQAAEQKALELEQTLNSTRDRLNAALANNENLKNQNEHSQHLAEDMTTLRNRLANTEQQLNQANTELDAQRHANEQLDQTLSETKSRLHHAEQEATQHQDKGPLISQEKLTQLHQTLQKETLRADSAARVKHQLEQRIEKFQKERDLARRETVAVKEKLDTYINMSKAEAEMNRTLEKLEAHALGKAIDEETGTSHPVEADLLQSAKKALADVPEEQPIIQQQLNIRSDHSLFSDDEEPRTRRSRWWLWAALLLIAGAGGYGAFTFIDPQHLPWNVDPQHGITQDETAAQSTTTQRPSASAGTAPSPAPINIPRPSTATLDAAATQAKIDAQERFQERLKRLNETPPPSAQAVTPPATETPEPSTSSDHPTTVPTELHSDAPIAAEPLIAETDTALAISPTPEPAITPPETNHDSAVPTTASEQPVPVEESPTQHVAPF